MASLTLCSSNALTKISQATIADLCNWILLTSHIGHDFLSMQMHALVSIVVLGMCRHLVPPWPAMAWKHAGAAAVAMATACCQACQPSLPAMCRMPPGKETTMSCTCRCVTFLMSLSHRVLQDWYRVSLICICVRKLCFRTYLGLLTQACFSVSSSSQSSQVQGMRGAEVST